MKCSTKLKTAKERCPIVFQGHPSNFKVTRDKTPPILTQIGRFRTIGRSQLSNPSDLPCWGWWTLTFKVKFNFKSKNLPHFELVRAMTRHPFGLGPPNLDQRCKIPWLRSLLFWGLIKLDMSNFNLFSESCLFASLLRLWNIGETCITFEKRSLLRRLNSCAQLCLPTALCHGPWNSRVVSLVWPLLASQSLTRRLAMDF